MGKRRRKKIRGENLRFLKENRDKEQVKEVLNVKIKHLRRIENRKRREYGRDRKRFEKEFQKDGKMGRFKRIVRRIAKEVSIMYRKGMEKVERRVNWSVKKIGGVEKKSTEEVWLEEIAAGSGSQRPRTRIIIPIYGNVTLSQDE